MTDKVLIYGQRIKELRTKRTALTQEKLATLIGKNYKQQINQLETAEKSYVTRTELDQLCKTLGCTQDYLTGYSDEPDITVGVKIITDPDTKERTEQEVHLRTPLIPDDNISYYVKQMRTFSSKKLCTIEKLIDYLNNCDDSQLDVFDKIASAYFSEALSLSPTNSQDMAIQYAKDEMLPWLTQDILDILRNSSEGKAFNHYELNDKSFLYSLKQNFGNFVKASKHQFRAMITRTIAECQESAPSISALTLNDITELAIADLAANINAHLYENTTNSKYFERLNKTMSQRDLREFRRGFAKYISRNLSEHTSVLKTLIQEYCERYISSK